MFKKRALFSDTGSKCYHFLDQDPSRARRDAHDAAEVNRPMSAHTFVVRPAQVNEADSARRDNHDDMRFMRHSNQEIERAHLPSSVKMFERALRAG